AVADCFADAPIQSVIDILPNGCTVALAVYLDQAIERIITQFQCSIVRQVPITCTSRSIVSKKYFCVITDLTTGDFIEFIVLSEINRRCSADGNVIALLPVA